jgi:hypothetical protein
MKFIVEYFGVFIFGFVVFVGALVTLPELGAPDTSPGEMGGLALAFVVIVGGFSWYYNAELPQRPPPRSQRSGSGPDVPRR